MFALVIIYFIILIILALNKRSKIIEKQQKNVNNMNTEIIIQQESVPVTFTIQDNYTESIESIISYENDDIQIFRKQREIVHIYNVE